MHETVAKHHKFTDLIAKKQKLGFKNCAAVVFFSYKTIYVTMICHGRIIELIFTRKANMKPSCGVLVYF